VNASNAPQKRHSGFDSCGTAPEFHRTFPLSGLRNVSQVARSRSKFSTFLTKRLLSIEAEEVFSCVYQVLGDSDLRAERISGIMIMIITSWFDRASIVSL
jgi:hypothetical protein